MSRELRASSPTVGARLVASGSCEFTIWAPNARTVEIELIDLDSSTSPPRGDRSRRVPLVPAGRGYHVGRAEQVRTGSRYWVRLDDGDPLPDPASRYQPQGVHGPSAVFDPRREWSDTRWRGRALREYVLYELHVGTFTAGGTFDSAVAQLDRLRELGITAIELMPVCEFPGARNWGYDGVLPFATHHAYGGPERLQAFVEACHHRGLAVVLDVVYNHLGPEGNVFAKFGPYFTNTYTTPWGPALNYDEAGSDEVRRFFIENALMWLRDFHFDALRLDAVHAIVDRSPYPFLTELADEVDALSETSWNRLLIAESDANDPRVFAPKELGGHGLDGVWADDFHHAVHVRLTGETRGYYEDYVDDAILPRAAEQGFGFTGEYSAHRGRRHGARLPARVEPERFVVCTQNHDQIGNRMVGDRLSTLAGEAANRLASAMLLLSPHTPLLFMGQEYGETRPFAYFVSHTDRDLVEAVRKGRRAEFGGFFAVGGEPPDPQSEQTFIDSRLDPSVREQPAHAAIEALHRALIELRRRPDFERLRDHTTYGYADLDVLVQRMGSGDTTGVAWLAAFNLAPEPRTIDLELAPGHWHVVLDSNDARLGGTRTQPLDLAGAGRLPSHGFVVLARTEEGV